MASHLTADDVPGGPLLELSFEKLVAVVKFAQAVDRLQEGAQGRRELKFRGDCIGIWSMKGS